MTNPTSPLKHPEPESARTVVFERSFPVPVRVVWEAHSKPVHLKKWFGPPGYPLTLCEMDFRVGGRYRFAMTGPDGVQNPPFGGEYLEIVPHVRIAFSNRFEFEGAETMTMTWHFEDRGSSTHLRMVTLFGSVAMKNEHLQMGFEQGAGAGLVQLAAVVADLAREQA